MENFKKIQEVYSKLSKMRELKSTYELSDMADLCTKECIELIREFIVDNDNSCKVKKKDLSVWSFVAHDKIRLVMNNVHYNHEDKVAVASDGRKLFVSHKDYRPIHKTYEVVVWNCGEKSKEVREYTIYDKYDNGIVGVYPNYKSVIPHDEYLTPVTLASEEEIRKRIAEAKAEHKLLGRGKPNERIAVSVMGDDRYGVDFTFVNGMILLDHLNIMLSAGLDGWQVKFGNSYAKDCKRAEMFVKKFDNGDVILLMPTRIEVDEDKVVNYDQINAIKYQSYEQSLS